MMIRKQYIIILISLVNTITCFSQKNFKFGNATATELNMKTYEKDTTANAVVLYEYGEAVINQNKQEEIEFIIEHTVRIKIFNSNAFNKATIEIPLRKSIISNRKETLIEATAISINPDRTTSTLKKTDIFNENYNKYYDFAKFTVPNLQEGTIIDYTYKILSPFHTWFIDWEFQSDIPKVFSQFHTSIPGNYLFNIKLVGVQKLTNRESQIKKDCIYFRSDVNSECVEETYTMENIPAFKEEDYMISSDNYLSAIRYELQTFRDFRGNVKKYTKSWKDVDKEFKFGDGPGKEAKKTNYFKDFIPSEIIAMPNTIEKAKKIFYQLQKELYWNKKYSIHTNIDVKEAYKNKSGSVAELNLILQNFLNASGFNSDFMVLSTRDNALPTKIYPVISEFNYLVIKLDIDDATYLLDITNKNIPFGILPFEALNEYGRVMDFKKGSYWYDFSTSVSSSKNTIIQFDVQNDGNVLAKVRETNSGYLGVFKRDKIVGRDIDDYLEEQESEFDENDNLIIEEHQLKNKENLEKPITEIFKLKFLEKFSDNNIYLNPFITNKFTKNPFTLEERTYPINFGYTFANKYQIIINLGDNYSVENIPESKTIKLVNNGGYLVYQTSKSDNKVLINLRFKMNKSSFNPTEYDGLKKFFSELVFLQNKQLIHIKKVTH